MGDRTDEQCQECGATTLSDEDVQALAKMANTRMLRSLAKELLGHRAAQRADAERVRSVVREVIDAELTERKYKAALGVEAWKIVDAIADRAAAQLAIAAPALSSLDRATVQIWRSQMMPWGNPKTANDTAHNQRCALLDKLLGTAVIAHPQIEPLPQVVRCGTEGCVSMIASDLLPGSWVMIDGVWQCSACRLREAAC